MSKWRNYPMQMQTIRGCKYEVIRKAGDLFCLTEVEKEALANKAGLSLLASDDFTKDFDVVVRASRLSCAQLCEMSLISERMFQHIRQGCHLRKETLLALLLTMGLRGENLQTLMKKAGYFLSGSLPGDVVVMWMSEHELINHPQKGAVLEINDVLFDLGLPLLMTREKRDS